MEVEAQQPLSAVLNNEVLYRRPLRSPSLEIEVRSLKELGRELLYHPDRVLQKLVDTTLEACNAGSAGISLLEEAAGVRYFRWHAVAGAFRDYYWQTMPRDSSPCGTVLDLQAPQFMLEPERHFVALRDVQPKITEALLIPFRVDGRVVGTLWVLAHDEERRFDGEDRRLVTSLSIFAAKAYESLAREGGLGTRLRRE